MVSWLDMLGLALLLIGVILTTIAIPTQEWTTYGRSTLGLWRICPVQASCADVDNSDDLDAVRAMVLMGDIVAVLAVLVMLVAFILEAARDMTSRWTKLVVGAAALLAGALTLAGVIVYTTEIHDEISSVSDKDKGYSFWLAIVALIFMFLSAFVFIVSAVFEERARLKLARKTAELRERSRGDHLFRKNGYQPGRGKRDVVRTPESHLINSNNSNNNNNSKQNLYHNGHLPNGTSNNKYRRRHRSASPGRRDYGNAVWDRYQHQYVPRLVPVATVLPDTEYYESRFGLPLGSYHHVDPVGPRGYISYVGNKGGHRRTTSGGYPGVHSFADWRRHDRLLGQGYTPYSDPYLYH